ncbi:MAG: hypothetical protein Unbinned5081contig1001_53 [Prokaryotic dsDNA virus sp.]|nr:MAG: hypothetical protein Unbinned5081contig1001_53 [Prokaryotic dsDNA virus sp.]
MRNPLLSIGVLVLAGCTGLTSLPVIENQDPCDRPVVIPSRWLNDAEIEQLWRRDRKELLDCGDKVEVLSGRAPSSTDFLVSQSQHPQN